MVSHYIPIFPTDAKCATLCAVTHDCSFGDVPAPSPDGLIVVRDAAVSVEYSYENRVYHPDGRGPALVSSDSGE